MRINSRIYIAGHRGLVGSAFVRKLKAQGYNNLILRTSKELDLRRQADVESFFAREKPEYVFLAAAKVGGIHANNTYPAEFIYDNIAIQTNVVHESWRAGVKRLLFLGSSCIYPRDCPQPMKEECLLTGPLEPTNEPYAVAKIAGIKMCQSYNRQYGTNFICAMPTNLYGPNDNFDLETSHVLPALIRKMHEAVYGFIPAELKSFLLSPQSSALSPVVTIWGTGTPRREFLHVDDLADAGVFLMNLPDSDFLSVLSPSPSVPPLVNIGCGEDITIRELAELVAKIVGFKGELVFDTSRPDGTPQKLLDVSKLRELGWQPKISLREGIRQTCEWYKWKFTQPALGRANQTNQTKPDQPE
ncbi:MAG: GDP-L-fucose synthase [Deltaproteobacteria bacterium]|nr:GDP-L-fucose synthase [Deltaproteobacteria bacterium]